MLAIAQNSKLTIAMRSAYDIHQGLALFLSNGLVCHRYIRMNPCLSLLRHTTHALH